MCIGACQKRIACDVPHSVSKRDIKLVLFTQAIGTKSLVFQYSFVLVFNSELVDCFLIQNLTVTVVAMSFHMLSVALFQLMHHITNASVIHDLPILHHPQSEHESYLLVQSPAEYQSQLLGVSVEQALLEVITRRT